MKRILYIIPLLLASLTACQKEEATDMPPMREQLFLTVSDGGYTSVDGAQSRATDNDLQTVFEDGDQVGFFSVGNNNTLEANNLCMTAKTVDGKLVWEAPAGTTLLTAGRYFIYYPYQPTLPGTVDATKATAAEFFAAVLAAWTPAADQSTQALYTASDLMIGRGVMGERGSDGKLPVSVTLNHTMGLVFISLPSLTYKFTNDSPAISDYTLPVSNAKFTGFTPLAMGDDKYRYLVKPGIDNTLQGTFTRNSESKKYSITANVAGGAFKACFVDGGGGTLSHTLAIGDFYMKDGTLISREETLTDMQRANCLGIVLKAGKDPAGSRFEDLADYKLKNGTTSAAIHAYVLALHGGNKNQWLSWGSNGTGVGTGQSRYDVGEDVVYAEGPIGFHGYTYTQMIKAKAPSLGQAFQTAFPAAYYASDGYEQEYASPANSSGWFLPSVGQCKYWLENKDILFESLLKAGGTDWRDNIGYSAKVHWSSSEILNQESGYVYYVILSDHSLIDSYTKDPPLETRSSFYVRSVLAF